MADTTGNMLAKFGVPVIRPGNAEWTALVGRIGELPAADRRAFSEDIEAAATGSSSIAMATGDGLSIIDFARWAGEPPERLFLWGTFLPLLQTTMLTGPGGVGKSLLAQQLLTCVALGLPFLGQETRQRNCLYVTCEDDTDELWRRQHDICRRLGVGLHDLAGKLHLVSLCGASDTALATFKDTGRSSPPHVGASLSRRRLTTTSACSHSTTRPTPWLAI